MSWGEYFQGAHVAKRFNIACLLSLAAIMLAGSAWAQTPQRIDFHLKRSKELKHTGIPKNGEFKLSLGSQMFASNPEEFNIDQIQSRFSPVVDDPSKDASLDDSTTFSNRNTLHLKGQRNTSKRLTPVITLNNSYEDNAIGPGDSIASGLSITGGNRRLQVYGEFETKRTPQILTIAPTSPSSVNYLRGSALNQTPGVSQPTNYDKNSALASRYYLEAVYSFKPTLKGKVSFKRSMIDTFESEEKLEVEGIVDANSDIQIKAGYNNEVRPELTEPRSNHDTKVWTEFILKF